MPQLFKKRIYLCDHLFLCLRGYFPLRWGLSIRSSMRFGRSSEFCTVCFDVAICYLRMNIISNCFHVRVSSAM